MPWAANGIGPVKLMGRDSGYIAAFAGLASNEANYVLLPEVKFTLKEKKVPVTLRYIDPSYIIRSVPASADDAYESIYCSILTAP